MLNVHTHKKNLLSVDVVVLCHVELQPGAISLSLELQGGPCGWAGHTSPISRHAGLCPTSTRKRKWRKWILFHHDLSKCESSGHLQSFQTATGRAQGEHCSSKTWTSRSLITLFQVNLNSQDFFLKKFLSFNIFPVSSRNLCESNAQRMMGRPSVGTWPLCL